MNMSNRKSASANIRLRWNYRPDTHLFVIYTVGQQFARVMAKLRRDFLRTISSTAAVPVLSSSTLFTLFVEIAKQLFLDWRNLEM